MANLQDFKNYLQRLREAVEEKLPDIAETIALSAKAIAERRIKDEGFGKSYSTNPIPVWFLSGKELNASGLKYIDANKKGSKKRGKPAGDGTGTWGEFRAAQGLQNSFVDLSYSNKMWANMQPVAIVREGSVVYARLGGTNTEAQNKMNWNRDEYGDFIGAALKPEDQDTLAEIGFEEIGKIIENI